MKKTIRNHIKTNKQKIKNHMKTKKTTTTTNHTQTKRRRKKTRVASLYSPYVLMHFILERCDSWVRRDSDGKEDMNIIC